MEIGQIVGHRWQLTGFLGRGGFGQVFEAVDTSMVGLGRAAVKVLHSNTSPAERDDFLSEVKKVAQMRHPNLVAYLDSGELLADDGSRRAYLVTELCDYSLADELARQPGARLPATQVHELVRHIAAGLTHLHQRDLLHRDLKSANILRATDGWKLADFGLMRDLSATGHYHRGELIKGTPLYMAPELFTGASQGKAADVYAFGVVVYEALSGRYPYQASSNAALVAQITSAEPSIDASLDPGWRQFVLALLRRDPAQRPSASQLTDLLEPDRQPLTVSPAAAAPTVAAPSPSAAHVSLPATTGSTVAPAPHGAAAHTVTLNDSGRGRWLVAASAAAAIVALGILAAVAWSVLGPDREGVEAATPSGDNPAASRLSDSNGSNTSTEADAGDETDAGDDAAAAALAPDERIAAILLTADDAPPDYEFEPVASATGGEFCDGINNPSTTHPGIASQQVEMKRLGQYFFAAVRVHDTVDEATKYINAAERLQSSCDGRRSDDSDDAITFELTEVTSIEVPGADQVTAMSAVGTGQGAVVEVSYISARVGDLTVVANGSHQATVEYYAQLMVARATDTPEPDQVEPPGPATGAVNATAAVAVREAAEGAAELTPALSSWFASHDDADIDLIMDLQCSALLAASNSGESLVLSVEGVYNDLDTDVREDLAFEDFGQLIGIGLVYYCPEHGEALLTEVDQNSGG